MNNMTSKKALIVECMMVLKKYSSQDHPLSADEIVNYIKVDYDNSTCRQAVYNYVKVLNDIGIQISKERRKFYYDDRDLLDEEVEILCHSVMANSTIPLVYSKELIEKLKGNQGIEFSKNKNLDFNIYNTDKRDNREIYMNIATISKAIDSGMTISFDYYYYDENKRLVKKRDKRYSVIPCRTVAMQNRFYLVAYHEKYRDYVHYRIDKMKDVRIESVSLEKHDIDPYEYTKHRLYMQTGSINEYVIVIDDQILDETIDLFGKDINIDRMEDDRYKVIVKTTEQAIIYFASQFVDHVEVKLPIDTREKIREMLLRATNKYGG